jgi:cytochrome c-type biogenesis protein CcmH
VRSENPKIEDRESRIAILHPPSSILKLLSASLLLASSLFAAQPVDLEDQVRTIAAELRCVVCQNLSVADSPSELAQQMRALIREQLQEGKSPEQIKAYFVSKYGEWVLLAPTPKGFSLLVWVLPFVAAASGIFLVIFATRRWVKKKSQLPPTPLDPSLIQRLQQDIMAKRELEADLESESPRSPLLQEKARLYSELRELEFDYQAGRLSETDYHELRQGPESEAAKALKELESFSPTPAQVLAAEQKRSAPKKEREKVPRSGWQLALGGLFLLLFGLTLGVLLTQSLRPRGSEQDTITGDFLTGTGPGGIGGSPGMQGMQLGSPQNLPALLAQGRAAFDRQEWSQAIDAFKGVLAIDPKNPEAHTYMGLILAQAGHADGAFLAFDRALSSDPNFPLALWGKGMLLYRVKEDYAGARETLERLVQLSPPGEERNQIQKTIDELASLPNKRPEKKAEGAGPRRTQGVISIAPELKSKFDAKAVLFVIARAANSTVGPPLAVKRIDRPVFPVAFSLGAEDVMISGMQLAGRITISARLDKDGNPMTREPGDLLGEYRNNPVEIGSQKVDIVIDRVL